MKTTCEHCVFKIMADGEQSSRGCYLAKIKSDDKKTNGFYELDRVCVTCRNVYWDKYAESESLDELEERVKEELSIRYNFLIDGNAPTTPETIKFYLDKIDLMKNKPTNVMILFDGSGPRHKIYQEAVAGRNDRIVTIFFDKVPFFKMVQGTVPKNADYFLHLKYDTDFDVWDERISSVNNSLCYEDSMPSIIYENDNYLVHSSVVKKYNTIEAIAHDAENLHSNNNEQE